MSLPRGSEHGAEPQDIFARQPASDKDGRLGSHHLYRGNEVNLSIGSNGTVEINFHPAEIHFSLSCLGKIHGQFKGLSHHRAEISTGLGVEALLFFGFPAIDACKLLGCDVFSFQGQGKASNDSNRLMSLGSQDQHHVLVLVIHPSDLCSF